MFKREEDYKEYKYSFDEVDNYVLNQTNKGYILLSIKNNDDVIGEIRFKGVENSCSEIGIILKSDEYKNKCIGTLALKKALEYAKYELKLTRIVASILKTNKRSQHIFNKTGFVLFDEDNHFYKYCISI